MYISRILNLHNENNDSVILWGARQVGKTTFLKNQYPGARYYDLLNYGEFERFLRNPDLLAEELAGFIPGEIVIIDEIQKIPELLDVVHSILQKEEICFILSGSSPRKLKRAGANLLGGRALKKNLYPLVSAEIPNFDIEHAVNNGMIPRHYLVKNAWERLRAYIGVYLEEEIREEAISRRLKLFSRFMEVAAYSNGEMIVYKNIAADCGIDQRTVKDYFDILRDTLIGYFIPGFTKTMKRRSIAAPKFYYYDVGIANFLLKRKNMLRGSEAFGHAYEHFIIQEIMAFSGYHGDNEAISYWRTASGYEVDVIIGSGEIAIEIKSSDEVRSRHLKGLNAFGEEFPDARLIIVSFDKHKRIMNKVEVWPAEQFLKELWQGGILAKDV
ncbi:MAG: DUF4143 domain-containing protein [Bacteroidetes bacterium]|nr:DUF4143 domain-containing protein [Bacteroidota bacterium]